MRTLQNLSCNYSKVSLRYISAQVLIVRHGIREEDHHILEKTDRGRTVVSAPQRLDNYHNYLKRSL